ncbi:TIGR03619 family F420-dependent LLM class oxidoreductase [Blastococcus sp. SYSU D00820]
MTLFVGLPNHGDYLGDRPWRALVGLAEAAEEAGVGGVSVVDHVVMGTQLEKYPYGGFPGGPEAPWLEPMTVLSTIAGATEDLRLATGVLISPLRPPALLAKSAATLDALSGGRLVLGVGTGWQAEEYEASGLDFARRHQLLDDGLAACHALWQGGPVDFTSETLSFSQIACYPRPVQAGGVPIWIGGKLTERNLERIVRWGSGWIPAPTDGGKVVAEGMATLRAAMEEAGRDPASVSVRISPRLSLDGNGRVDQEAFVANTRRMLEAGGTDVLVMLQAWCPDPADAPAVLRDLADAMAAV